MNTSSASAASARPRSRRYRGRADLPPLIAFASACTAARSPLFSTWSPGDVVWALQTRADERQPCRFWIGQDGAEVLAWFVGANEVWLEALPESEAIVPHAIKWAESAMARRAGGSSLSLKIRAYLSDEHRIATLESMGYRCAGAADVNFRISFAEALPKTSAPVGLAVRDSVRIDPDARAKAHRAAWNHLEHLGIEARSSFTTETYLSLTHLPAYDASLDMLAVTPMGELVGNCIAWADDASGVAVFEPVGVAPAWRGRRVASSMMGEALRRLKARGFAEARASTASFNHAAVAAYLACGFKRADECWWWEKTIDQAPNGQQSKTSGPRGQRKIAVKPHPGGWESAWNREEP